MVSIPCRFLLQGGIGHTARHEHITSTVIVQATNYFEWSSIVKRWEALTPHSHRLGVLCIILGFALGIANIFHFNLLIIFSIILLYVSRNAHFLELQLTSAVGALL
jgi:hypothetical protein